MAPHMATANGSLLVVEPASRVSNAVANAAEALSARTDFKIDTSHCPSLSPTDITRALQRLADPKIVLVVQPPGGATAVASTVSALVNCVDGGTSVVVTPDPGGTLLPGIGWIPSLSGISQLLWLLRGARGVVARQELSSPAICRRLVQQVPNLTGGAALVIGKEPVDALDALHSNVTDVWRGLYDARSCWRAAFALSACAPLISSLNQWINIARHLTQSLPWFTYNQDDVRKALGRLGEAWGYTYKPARYQIAAQARMQGYLPDLPSPGSDIDALFDAAMELDVSARREFSAIGIESDELPLRMS